MATFSSLFNLPRLALHFWFFGCLHCLILRISSGLLLLFCILFSSLFLPLKRFCGNSPFFCVGRSFLVDVGSSIDVSSVFFAFATSCWRLLAAYRLWLQELRGRLDVAFIQIAGLRGQGPEYQEIRAEVARTVFNFNSRLQGTEDDLEQVLERNGCSREDGASDSTP